MEIQIISRVAFFVSLIVFAVYVLYGNNSDLGFWLMAILFYCFAFIYFYDNKKLEKFRIKNKSRHEKDF